jgi:aminoglycoside phosphotransferase (APT) family kinase protein
MPTTRPGFPSRREAAEAYAKITGVDLSELRFHRVLATFKTAVIFAQLYTRFHEGMTQDERYAHFGELASGLLDFAHELSLGNYY